MVLDLQIGNMGGIAVAIDLRLEAGEGRLPHTQILLLLDREADRFLARRADVDVVLVKPVDAGRPAPGGEEPPANGARSPDASSGVRLGGVDGPALHSPPLRDVAQFG